MEIREIRSSDLVGVGEIASLSFDDYSSQDYEKMSVDPNYKFWICEENGIVAGYLIFLHIDTKLEIIKIATSPNFRRRGIAEELLRRLFEFGRANGYEGVILEVNDKNLPAIGLYRKAGFEQIHVRKRYYNNLDDAIIMTIEF